MHVVALQQRLPLAVCDEGGETVEKQSDDEVRISLVPDQRENEKNRVKELTDYGIETFRLFCLCNEGLCQAVVTVLTACGIETHIS